MTDPDKLCEYCFVHRFGPHAGTNPHPVGTLDHAFSDLGHAAQRCGREIAKVIERTPPPMRVPWWRRVLRWFS